MVPPKKSFSICLFYFTLPFWCLQFLTDCVNTFTFAICYQLQVVYVYFLQSIPQQVVFVNFTKKEHILLHFVSMNYTWNHYKINAGTENYLIYTKLLNQSLSYHSTLSLESINTAHSTQSSKNITLLSKKQFFHKHFFYHSLRNGIDLTKKFKAQTVLLY